MLSPCNNLRLHLIVPVTVMKFFFSYDSFKTLNPATTKIYMSFDYSSLGIQQSKELDQRLRINLRLRAVHVCSMRYISL